MIEKKHFDREKTAIRFCGITQIKPWINLRLSLLFLPRFFALDSSLLRNSQNKRQKKLRMHFLGNFFST
jgi:hypothetical protein